MKDECVSPPQDNCIDISSWELCEYCKNRLINQFIKQMKMNEFIEKKEKQ